MKKLMIFLFIIFCLYSCNGNNGIDGLTGPGGKGGANGNNGSNGSDGTDGSNSTNVYYSTNVTYSTNIYQSSRQTITGVLDGSGEANIFVADLFTTDLPIVKVYINTTVFAQSGWFQEACFINDQSIRIRSCLIASQPLKQYKVVIIK